MKIMKFIPIKLMYSFPVLELYMKMIAKREKKNVYQNKNKENLKEGMAKEYKRDCDQNRKNSENTKYYKNYL